MYNICQNKKSEQRHIAPGILKIHVDFRVISLQSRNVQTIIMHS